MASGVRPVAQARGPAVAAGRRVQRRWLGRVARRYPLGAMAGIAILGLTVFPGLANHLAPYDPLANDFGTIFAAPGARHWFGPDAFGPDVLHRNPYAAGPR